MNSIEIVLNSTWTVNFIPYETRAAKKKKKNANTKLKRESKPTCSICLDTRPRPRLVLQRVFSSFFYFIFFSAVVIDQFSREQCTWDPQTSLFSNFFIKNESHNTINIFKNYFATVFSVFNFSKISFIQTDL